MFSERKSMHSHLVDESGYEVWRDFSGRHTYLKWDNSKHSSGSGVPAKYQSVWKIMERLGKYLSRKKKNGLVFNMPFSSITIDFYESDNKDWNMKIRGFATMVNGEKHTKWGMNKNFSNQEIGEIRKKNKQAIKRALKGLRISRFFIYDDDINLEIKRPRLSAPPQYKTTEVFVSSGDGRDREQVLYALERQLGFYPSDFEILSSASFEDDEDIVKVKYKKGSLIQRVARLYLINNGEYNA